MLSDIADQFLKLGLVTEDHVNKVQRQKYELEKAEKEKQREIESKG